MFLTAPIWTGPNSPQKGQVGKFAEHPVVRRVATDGLVWQAVEYRNTAVVATSP